MSAPHSLCIATPRLYANARTSRNGPDRHPVIPVSSSFVIRVGVYRNFVRERRRRRHKMRQANPPAAERK